MNLLNEFTILFFLYPKQTIQFTQQLRVFLCNTYMYLPAEQQQQMNEEGHLTATKIAIQLNPKIGKHTSMDTILNPMRVLFVCI